MKGLSRWCRLASGPVVMGMLAGWFGLAAAAEPAQLQLEKGDRIAIIGNTLAERMQYFGHFETLLHSRFPELELVVRNLGWSADELTLRPRSKDFADHGHSLADHRADVVLAMFGFNESFAGAEGLAQFEREFDAFLTETLSSRYNGHSAPRLAIISPIAHENLRRHGLPDGQANNRNIQLYTESMRKLAAARGVPFVDLYAPTLELYAQHDEPLTINGIHLNERGDRLVGQVLDAALFGPRPPASDQIDLAALRAEVNEKNLQFFYDHRAVNGYYIYGGRKAPFGVVNFPAEFEKLRAMIANRDRRIWQVAQGQPVPEQIDDSNTGAFVEIETNAKVPILITDPEDERQKLNVAEGFEVTLFASEADFPELENPVQFAFDNRGRLWVCTMPSYPQYLPGVPVDDKILILEDTTGDGRADKCTVFADGLHVPTGIEFGQGGVFVAQQPNVLFLKDTTGDDRADVREYVLHGFDSADSHHAISAFVWDQSGALYFQEGTFHHTQVETPYGPRRCANAGVFRWVPRTGRFDIWVSYGFANPWGHIIDRWGQNLVADASGGANYFGAAFSGDVDYPDKHQRMEQFLVKQWRPTAGCELVSSRNFPDEMQGNYLLNNCIGFQGVLQYKMRDEGSGVAADPVEPLLQSADPNFRPVDIEFGPDGALYLCDWYNPLVGHMQHSLRDPNRDKAHGRIWRVHYKHRPLVSPPQIAGRPVAELLDALKNTAEERACYRIRTELRDRPTDEVLAALDAWQAGLDTTHADYEHQRLESLWLRQAHDVVDEALLRQVLRSPDFRARAAATRVLCYWLDRVSEPLALLRQQARDEHPRVRLEAVRALSFERANPLAALEVAYETLFAPQDYYLGYTLNETISTLEGRLRRQRDDVTAATPLVAIVQKGELSAEREAQLLQMICARGNAAQLGYVAGRLFATDDLPAAQRLDVLAWLTDAAVTRKVQPDGDLTALGRLVHEQGDPRVQLGAIRLASAWKLSDIADDLQALAANPEASVAMKRAALDGLVAIGDAKSRETVRQLARTGNTARLRFLAAAALVRVNLNSASEAAAQALASATPRDNSAPLLDAFLTRKGGAEKLAAALAAVQLDADVAKVALRHMYSVGRSDADLSNVLSVAAGVAVDVPPPSQDEVLRIAAEAMSKGDPARGEQVFRRQDLSCQKCHAINRAGGNVGPELTAVGSISPPDYIVSSILNPGLAVKEQYVTRVVITRQGEAFTGIVIDRDRNRLRLRDASGKELSIPLADIEEEAEGPSLMPQGLTKFLTHDELLDLARFVSELGKPGAYEVRKTPAIQRWRVLKETPAELTSALSNAETFRRRVLAAPADAWNTIYGMVSGALPLGELPAQTSSKVVYLQGEIEVTEPGAIELGINCAAPLQIWIDQQAFETAPAITTSLAKGRHKVTVRVDLANTPRGQLTVELRKPANSRAQFDAVGGI